MTHNRMTVTRFAIALGLAFCALPTHAEAGRVEHLAGTLSVQRADGGVKLLSAKSEVLGGDTLQTEKDSYAQIRFTDGGTVTLKPGTRFAVHSYGFDPGKAGNDNLVFRLLKGGLRTVTGLIGKRGNLDAFRMETATATIGIRGTTFEADDCKTTECRRSSGGGQDGDGTHEPGVYVTVHDGEVEVRNAAGALNLSAGQFGLVPSETVVPRRLPGDPGLAAAASTTQLESTVVRARGGFGRCEP